MSKEKTTSPDFRRADSSSFGDLLGRIPCLERRLRGCKFSLSRLRSTVTSRDGRWQLLRAYQTLLWLLRGGAESPTTELWEPLLSKNRASCSELDAPGGARQRELLRLRGRGR